MLLRFVLIWVAEAALSCRCVSVSSDARSELTCLQVAWLADPECAGLAAGLVVRGAAECVELLVLVLELHAASPTAQPATRIAAAILAGPAGPPLAAGPVRRCLFMRTCFPAPEGSASPAWGEVSARPQRLPRYGKPGSFRY